MFPVLSVFQVHDTISHQVLLVVKASSTELKTVLNGGNATAAAFVGAATAAASAGSELSGAGCEGSG